MILSQEFRKALPDLLNTVEQYVNNTYGQHYVSADQGSESVQVIDMWDNMGIAESMFQGDIVKYGGRFGRKGGKNPKDAMKILHYALLLYYTACVRNNGETAVTTAVDNPDIDNK